MTEGRAITISMVGNDAWVVPHGDLDLANTADLESALTNAATCSQRYVFVDLANVTFIDAAGIGAIVRAATTPNSQGLRIKLLGAAGQVQQVLDLTGIGPHFGIEAHLLDQPQPTGHQILAGMARAVRRVQAGLSRGSTQGPASRS